MFLAAWEMQCGLCDHLLFSANLGSVNIGHDSTGMQQQWTEMSPIYTACVCGFISFKKPYKWIKWCQILVL